MEDLINERCGWAGTDPLYVKYHDEEWGRPVTDDNKLFEFLLLESAQAGLSWLTILRKREGYRQAFCAFVPERVAQMTTPDIDRLMHFDGIVKNRKKNRSRHRQCAAVPCPAAGIRQLWQLCPFLFAKPTTDCASCGKPCASSRNLTRSRGAQPGYEKTRLQIFRTDNLLRFFAGDRLC